MTNKPLYDSTPKASHIIYISDTSIICSTASQ